VAKGTEGDRGRLRALPPTRAAGLTGSTTSGNPQKGARRNATAVRVAFRIGFGIRPA
jgi:hypothetical protein